MPSLPTTFSIAEAAAELGVTERRVRQLIEEGRLVAELDGMGRARLTKAQLSNELKRRGRSSVKSLPSVPAAAIVDVDPLLARLDRVTDVLEDVAVGLRGLQRDLRAMMDAKAAERDSQGGRRPARQRQEV